MLDYNTVSQAILGAFIIGGFLVQHWKSRQRAQELKNEAAKTAAKVATVAQIEADQVRERVELTGTETRRQLREITVMVDGRLDSLIAEVHRVRSEIDELKGDSPGTSASKAGPQLLHDPLD
jgi:outer membrane murein-binding lipoprotein Lpp